VTTAEKEYLLEANGSSTKWVKKEPPSPLTEMWECQSLIAATSADTLLFTIASKNHLPEAIKGREAPERAKLKGL